MKTSKGNLKLPVSIGIFNQPAIKTCNPYHCKDCKSICYAIRAEKRFPAAKKSRAHNLRESKKSTFIVNMTSHIANMRVKTFRIHESGDFYNQTYLDGWVSVAKALPNIQFYAYTKSIDLDFSKRPTNLRIIASVPCNDLDGVALVVNKGITLAGFLACPGSCKTCSYCYSNGKSFRKIAFTIH